jgi:hypothetical protein
MARLAHGDLLGHVCVKDPEYSDMACAAMAKPVEGANLTCEGTEKATCSGPSTGW